MKRSSLILAAKFLFVFALLFFLGKKGFLSLEGTARAFGEWQLILLAFTAMAAANALALFRWHILLGAQGIHLPFSRTLELGFVGIFFNLALPGAVSGDFVKAFYVGKESEGRRAHAFSSILFDRVTGLAALILVSASGLLISYFSNSTHPRFLSLEAFVLTSGLIAIFFYAALFLIPTSKDPFRAIFHAGSLKLKTMGSILRIYDGLRDYRTKPQSTFVALAISLFIHTLVTCAFIELSHAIGNEGIPLLSYFVIVPLGLLVTAIPVTPAGVGTGHAAYLALFSLVGSQKGADVFSLYVVLNLLFGVIGGLVYLRFRHSCKDAGSEASPFPNPSTGSPR